MNKQFFHSIPHGSTLDILIIESSLVFSKLLGVYLEEIKDFEVNVQTVRSFEAAQEILLKEAFHAVILNLNLPDCLHEKTFALIHEFIPDTAIIITTSSSDQSAAILAVKNGAQDFLYKSDINSIILRKTVLFAIDRQHLANVAEEREKLLLSHLVARKTTTPLDLKSWAERVTRGLKRLNVGFPGKRKTDRLWDEFNCELRQAFLKHGLPVDDSFDQNERPTVELVEEVEELKDSSVSENSSCCSFPNDILVVEDSPINRKICRVIGDTMGLNMTFVNDGEQAVKAFRKHMYDLVFMDIQMPNMDGLEATRIIRSEFEKLKQPKIIALSASDPIQYMDLYKEVGMDGMVQKPIRKEKIEAVIRSLYPTERESGCA